MQSPVIPLPAEHLSGRLIRALRAAYRSLRNAFRSRLMLVMVLAAIIVIPRGLVMIHAHSESNDDQYHLQRGLYMLCGKHDWMFQSNDPPLGEEIIALPMFVLRCVPGEPINPDTMPDHGQAMRSWDAPRIQPHRWAVLYGHWLKPESIILVNAAWNSLLFVPFVGLCFHWCRSVYGDAAGWLGAALVVFEPTMAAHVPVAALDVLGVEFITLSCWLIWRYAIYPTKARLIGVAFIVAATMLIKHTAVILPAVAILTVLVFNFRRKDRAAAPSVKWTQHLAIAIAVWAVSMWSLCNFDYSAPYNSSGPLLRLFGRADGPGIDFVNDQMVRRWPGGIYIASIVLALNHATRGHWALLLGENRSYGWWYYFIVVSTYKVPLGLFALMGLGIASLGWRKPFRDELGLLIPAVIWSVFISKAPVDIGFRHFLPPYTFMLLMAVRVVQVSRVWLGMAWACCVWAAVSAIPYHPDYIAYLNWPRRRAYLDISDSNVEWGQSVKQIRQWLVEHPQKRQVWVRFGWSAAEKYYLDDLNVNHLDFFTARPIGGLLIIRPVWVAGMYDPTDGYAALRNEEPDAEIGHAVLVYDLDRLFAHGFKWWPRLTIERRTDWHPSSKPSESQ